MAPILCVAHKVSILRLSLFFSYINYLSWASDKLQPSKTYSDNTNLFHSHHNVRNLVNIVNAE